MLAQCVAAIALCAVLAAAMPSDQFEMFEAKYNKAYPSTQEREYRKSVFTQTLKRIEELNRGEPYRPHGVNQFADLTAEEFRAQYLMDPATFAAVRKQQAEKKYLPVASMPAELPTSYDWRNNNVTVVSPVKNQGQCGSCWAFSATENIESVWALAGNTLVELAPQQIVDCDKTDDGCNGGDTPTAFEYVIKAGGLELESSYPYTAKDGTCKAKASLEVGKIKGYEWATQTKNETEIQIALYNIAPLAICVDASSWQTYTSGIVTKNCGTSLDHCVQLTGWGTQTGTNYWSVRNSWAASWGEKGYIRVEMGKNLCGIAEEANTSVAE